MKNYTLILIAFFFFGTVKAQLLFDNGPLINMPDSGAGGANASVLLNGITTYGSNHSIPYKYRVADDFTVPGNQTWTIDSIVFFAYQTGSTLESSMTTIHLQVWEGSPMLPEGFVLTGDSSSNMLSETSWSGIYRTLSYDLKSTLRPIMKNKVIMPGLSLTEGTYWLDWSTGGSLASGPWVPVVVGSSATTGDALQYVADTDKWYEVIDGGTSTGQGFPFLIYGSSVTGIMEVEEQTSVNLYPNPFSTSTTVKIKTSPASISSNGFTFIIYDMLGKEVKIRSGIKAPQFTIEGNELNKGIYVYQVLNDRELLKTGKLVID